MSIKVTAVKPEAKKLGTFQEAKASLYKEPKDLLIEKPKQVKVSEKDYVWLDLDKGRMKIHPAKKLGLLEKHVNVLKDGEETVVLAFDEKFGNSNKINSTGWLLFKSKMEAFIPTILTKDELAYLLENGEEIKLSIETSKITIEDEDYTKLVFGVLNDLPVEDEVKFTEEEEKEIEATLN